MLKYYFEIEFINNSINEENVNNYKLLILFYREQHKKMLKKLHGIFSKEIEKTKINKEDGINKFGISFPEYNQEKYTLGKKIRVFSEKEEDLINLIKNNNIITTEEIFVTKVRSIPNQRMIKYAIYKKVMNPPKKENRINRYKSRHPEESIEEILKKFKNFDFNKR